MVLIMSLLGTEALFAARLDDKERFQQVCCTAFLLLLFFMLLAHLDILNGSFAFLQLVTRSASSRSVAYIYLIVSQEQFTYTEGCCGQQYLFNCLLYVHSTAYYLLFNTFTLMCLQGCSSHQCLSLTSQP